jgi:hypothetical protein
VVELTVLDMSSLYVQGTAGQVIEITETRVWGGNDVKIT